jgi:hypothetical protein
MTTEKKQYQTPELVVYGNIEKITMGASAQNRDSPTGGNNTAYPNGSP